MDTSESRALRVSGETRCSRWRPLRRCQPVSSCSDYSFSILVNFQHIIRSAEEGVAITVFFDEDATDEQMQKAIGEALEARRRRGRSKVHFGRSRHGRISRRSILETTRSWQKDLKTTTRWPSSDNYEVYMKTSGQTARSLISEKPFSFGDAAGSGFVMHRVWTACREVNKSDVVAKTLSSVNTLVAVYFDRKYHCDPVWECRSS